MALLGVCYGRFFSFDDFINHFVHCLWAPKRNPNPKLTNQAHSSGLHNVAIATAEQTNW